MSEMWVSLKRIEVSDHSRGVAKDWPVRAQAHPNQCWLCFDNKN